MTGPLIHWRVLAIHTMFGQPLAYRAVTAGLGCIKIHQICWLWHIGQSPLANSAVTAAICQRSPQLLCKLPQSAKSAESGQPVCTSVDVILCGLSL
jgi:hypothetical protein